MIDKNQSRGDEEIVHWAAELFKEMTLEKRAARKRDEKSAKDKSTSSRWESFWRWWKEYGGSFSALATMLFTVIGALWTLNQFIIQQRQRIEQQQLEAELRRQSMIVQYAIDLSDNEKRNSAAYALAVLAKEAAIPLLGPHLVEASRLKQDAAFRDALIQAFITIGEPSLPYMLDMNRQAATSLQRTRTVSNPTILSTQLYILHFIRHNAGYLIQHEVDFSGVYMWKPDLRHQDLSNLNLSGMRIRGGSFCRANLNNINLEGASLYEVNLGGTRLEGANLNEFDFEGELYSANMSRVTGEKASFEGSYMAHTSMSLAVLRNSNFKDVIFIFADLEKADLSGSDFSTAQLFEANLRGATLVNTDFKKTDLRNTDFSGADLAGAVFSLSQYDNPYVPQNLPSGFGAIVMGANFSQAENIDADTRVYLCRWGALNVPGGCNDIPKEDFPYQLQSDFTRRSCW